MMVTSAACLTLSGGCYALFVLPGNVCSRGDWVAMHTDAYVLLFEPYMEEGRERYGVSDAATRPTTQPTTQPASMPSAAATFATMYESFSEMRELGRELRRARRDKEQRAGRRRVIFAWEGDFKPVADCWSRCNSLARRSADAFRRFERASLAHMRALAKEQGR